MTSATAIVRRHYNLYAPDSTYHRPGFEPIAGSAGLAEFFTGQRGIRSAVHTLEQVVAVGENVAVRGGARGVRDNGEAFDLLFADFFVLRPDGRIARRDTYYFIPIS
jgi:steroid Delta-isomerase